MLPRFPAVEPALQEAGLLKLSSNPVGEGYRNQGRMTRGTREAFKLPERRGMRIYSYGAKWLPWRD